jgi:TRAP-type C4-dicarboxylate transport system permease small subunit
MASTAMTGSGLLHRFRWVSLRVNIAISFMAAIYAFGIVWVTVIDVVGRYALNKPLPAANEIGEMMVVYAAFLGLGLVQLRREHAAITMLVDRFSPNYQITIRLFLHVLCAAFFALFAWQSCLEAIHSTQLKIVYISYGVPMYPAQWAVFVGFSLLSLQLLLDAAFEAAALTGIGAKKK